MILFAVITVVHTTTTIDFTVNLICIFCIVNEFTTVGTSQQCTAVDVALSVMLFTTPDADGRVTDMEHIFIFASFNDRKRAVIKALIITIMSALGDNESTSRRRASLQSPQVGKLKNDRHNPLNDVSIRGVNVITFTVVALGIESALYELVFSVMEHLPIDFRFIPILISLVMGIYRVENHA
jgi:hypothetical protein